MNYSYSYIEDITENLLKQHNFYRAGFNVCDLAKEIGVTIIEEKMDSDVSGLFVKNGDKPIISINKKEGDTRKRFTVAHELGHYFLHSEIKPIFVDKTPKVLYRNTASSSGEIHQEREANAYAAALLMPSSLVKAELENVDADAINPIKDLADKFNVSEPAMSFRLANLGYDAGLYSF